MSDDDLEAGIPDKLFFRIGESAELVGVEPHVLRYWESEFRMRPQRSSSGQRMYRRKDLSRFFQIKRLLHDEGYTIAGARKVLTGGRTPGKKDAAEVSPVDTARVKEALQRLGSVRQRIADARSRFATVTGRET